jgi:hypothetical protein
VDSVEVTGAGGRLYVSDVSLDDGAGWSGNDDGEAGWGERLGLEVSLTNGGTGTETGVTGSLYVVEGCSVWVDVVIDSVRDPGLVHIGREGSSPGAIPFEVGLEDGSFGRYMRDYGHDLGCWIWLDSQGWHVRMQGDDDTHTYICSLEVYGRRLGESSYLVEGDDTLSVGPGGLRLAGNLSGGDYEDGFDFVAGSGRDLTIHDEAYTYGNVGASPITGIFDVEFLAAGAGDGSGVWFELAATSDGGYWRDWFRVLVADGVPEVEKLAYTELGGDTLNLHCFVRNNGGGALAGVEGRLRSLSGAEITDSTDVYGDICAGCLDGGAGFDLLQTGGAVSYEIELTDDYGRVWIDTIDVRDPAVIDGLTHEPDTDGIILSWNPSGDSLLAGYDVYRSDSLDGDYLYAGSTLGFARYVDGGLESEESYFYYVCARDSMGNISESSDTLEAWTGSPYLTGWPAGPPNVMPSSVVFADLWNTGRQQVIVGSKDQKVYVFSGDGEVAAGWPRSTEDEIWSSAAVGQMDEDEYGEFVIGSNDGCLYAWNHNGQGVRYADGLFRNAWGAVRGAPVLDDLDGDLDNEVIAANVYGQVWIWHHDGSGYTTGNGLFGEADGAIYGSPTIADIDFDDEVEVIVGTTAGSVFAWNLDGTGVKDSTGILATGVGGMYCSIAAGDLDNNGDMEMVFGLMFGRKAKVLSHQGFYHAGWPVDVDCNVYGSPALADFNGDDSLEVVIGTRRDQYDDSSSVYVFAHDGSICPGWPQTKAGDFESSPVVGDIDGDGEPDIVAGCTDGRIYAWHFDGTPVAGWPRNVDYPFYGTAAITDVRGNGQVEVAIGGYDGLIHIFDIDAPYDPATMEWPKLCRDNNNSGCYHGGAQAAVDPEPRDRVPTRLMLAGYPNPAKTNVTVRLGIPSSRNAERVRVDVFDVTGRHVRRLHDGRLDPGFHELAWDGTSGYNRRVSSGIYFVRVSWQAEGLSKKIVLVR